MSHDKLREVLLTKGYTRVERDDRLLDVFPRQTREKGVELWEKWTEKEVVILRIRLPFSERKIKLYSLGRQTLEATLSEYTELALDTYLIATTGEVVVAKL